MRRLEFTKALSQKIYDQYIDNCAQQLKRLRPEDQDDCLMEINSYIHEFMQSRNGDDETESLDMILSRLGDPAVVLRETVAAKKVEEASRTFRPLAVIEAIFLNLRNGVVYVIAFVLALLLLSVPVLIGYKLLQPERVGLWIGGKSFVLGTIDSAESANAPVREILGHAFIPVVVFLGALVYSIIVLLLRSVRKKHPGVNAIFQKD